IINMSLGGSLQSKAMTEAINYAFDNGVLVVASTGNDEEKDWVAYPAACDRVLAVSAYQMSDGEEVETYYANYDKEMADRIIHAPGENIISSVTDSKTAYAYKSGTSMAAPHVTGFAALVKARYPSLSGDSLRDKVLEMAKEEPYRYFDEDKNLHCDSDHMMHILSDGTDHVTDIRYARLIFGSERTIEKSEIASAEIKAQLSIDVPNPSANLSGKVTYAEASMDLYEHTYVVRSGTPTYEGTFEIKNGVGTININTDRYDIGDAILVTVDTENTNYPKATKVFFVGDSVAQEFSIHLPEGDYPVPESMSVEVFRYDPSRDGNNYVEFDVAICDYDEATKTFSADMDIPYGKYTYLYVMHNTENNTQYDCYLPQDYMFCDVDSQGNVVTPVTINEDSEIKRDFTIKVIDPEVAVENAVELTENNTVDLKFDHYAETKWFRISDNYSNNSGCSIAIGGMTGRSNSTGTLVDFAVFVKDNGKLVQIDDEKVMSSLLWNSIEHTFCWAKENDCNEYYLRIKAGGTGTIVYNSEKVVQVSMTLPPFSEIGISAVDIDDRIHTVIKKNETNQSVKETYVVPLPIGSNVKLEYFAYDRGTDLSYTGYGAYNEKGLLPLFSNGQYIEKSKIPAQLNFEPIKIETIKDDYTGNQNEITLNNRQYGVLNYFEDEDIFSLSVRKSGKFDITMNVSDYCNLDIYEKAKDGNRLTYHYALDNYTRELDETFRLEKGKEYLFVVNHYGKFTNLSVWDGSYSFTISGENDWDEVSFTDKSSISFWAEEAVNALTSLSIITGYPDNTFRPQNNITRAEFVSLLAKFSGEDLSARKNNTYFTDVPENHWSNKAVGWAYEHKIVNGKTKDLFCPDDKITREEMAAMMYRYITITDMEMTAVNEPMTYADEDDFSDYAKEAIANLQKWNIMNGKGNQCFVPKANTTREESATAIYRLMK
ncbi:MAG: S8 family peptidase, partial [Clostridia bacterium]